MIKTQGKKVFCNQFNSVIWYIGILEDSITREVNLEIHSEIAQNII